MGFAFAQCGGGPFGRGGAGLAKHHVVKRHQLRIEGARFFEAAGQSRAAHVGKKLGRGIGGNGDYAVAAAKHKGHAGGVVAGIHGEAFGRAVDEVDFAADVAAGFFHADDVGDFGQAQDGVVVDVDHGAAGHVIHNHRNGGGFGDGFEMAVDAFLRRLIVVGHYG